MLKVIIADDEKIQREGIFKYIPWSELGMEVIGIASDGIEAFELAESHNPDILITDVKMPRLDGLELSQKVRSMFSDTKILIISGYEEFEYARAAIEYNVYSYMIKPIDIAEMKQELEKIGCVCTQEMTKKQEFHKMKNQLEESKPLLVDKFIKDLLYGVLADENTIINRAEYLSVLLPKHGFYVSMIQVEPFFDINISEENKYIFYIDFINQLRSICDENWKNILVQIKENEFALVLFYDKQTEEVLLNTFSNIREDLGGKNTHDITIGVSKFKQNIYELHEAFKEAEVATRHKFYLGKGKNIYYGDIDTQAGMSASIEDEYEKLIINMEIGNVNLVGQTIDRIFSLFVGTSMREEHNVKALCYRMVGDIYRVLYTMNENAENIFGEEYLLWNKISRFETIPDVRQWLKNILVCISNHIYNKNVRKNSGVVEVIIETLEKNYTEHITIENLAKQVYLTPNYICNIFKENTGESIIDYLIKIRMRNAKQLLSDASLRIYEVAENVGFGNTSYFGQVFKNAFGITPKEYRDTLFNGHNHEKKL